MTKFLLQLCSISDCARFEEKCSHSSRMSSLSSSTNLITELFLYQHLSAGLCSLFICHSDLAQLMLRQQPKPKQLKMVVLEWVLDKMCSFGLILEYFYQVSIKLLEHQSCIQNSRERTLQWTCFSCRHSSPLLRWQLMDIEQWDRSPEVSLHAREQPQTTRGFKQESGISDTSECFQTLSLMGRNSRHLIIVTTQTTPQKN